MRADDDGAAPSLDDFWIMIKGWREARNGAVSFLELLHLNVRFQTTCAEGLVGPYRVEKNGARARASLRLPGTGERERRGNTEPFEGLYSRPDKGV